MLGNSDNYRMFASDAKLDFPKDRSLDDVSKSCTIARVQLMVQAQPENSLWYLKQRKFGKTMEFVSYVDCRSFCPLQPYIENLFIVTSLLKLSDVLCEVTCINHSFFVAYM